MNKKGMALPIVLIFVLCLVVTAAAFILLSNNEIQLVRQQKESTKAFYVAEGGTEQAITQIKALYAPGVEPTDAQIIALGGTANAPVIAGFQFTTYDLSPGPVYNGTITLGTYAGLQARIRPITITAEVRSTVINLARARVVRTAEAQSISVFQFGVFYEEDLEIIPGPNMTFAGRVHTNGDLYVASGATLSFDSYTTAYGSIYHDRKDDPGNPANGPVQFKDAGGVYQDMFQAGEWLDSRHANWAAESQTRWGGMVKDNSHDVTQLKLPIPVLADSHNIIERTDPTDPPALSKEKFHKKAGLRIVDGVATDGDGFSVTLQPGVVTTRNMYDYREGKTMTITEVDVGALIASAQVPSNAIIYVSETGADKGVRLVNGAQLPAGGLTVASDNPMYIKGDYNTLGTRQPSSVLADAVYILSNNWDDANSSLPLAQRQAASTTVNVAIVTGNTDTTVSNYNGGLENLMRFLERWSGRTLTYEGSIICMWNSEQATGAWYYGGNYYTAPQRNWHYDPAFANPTNAPPGVPNVYVVERAILSQIAASD